MKARGGREGKRGGGGRRKEEKQVGKVRGEGGREGNGNGREGMGKL